MATEGAHLDDYDPALRAVLTSEVVGVSVALVEGDVGEYERLERSLRGASFEMARDEHGNSVSWRWVGGTRSRVTLEFFCAATAERPAGRLHRPGGVVGGRLSALALDAGNLIDRDAREVVVEAELPAGGGHTSHALKVAGPASYLAAKVDALRRRTKNKDAYDIVWLVECWPGGQAALAAELAASTIRDDLAPFLEILREEFRDIDCAGAVKYGRFMAREASAVDAHARRAVGAIAELFAHFYSPGAHRR